MPAQARRQSSTAPAAASATGATSTGPGNAQRAALARPGEATRSMLRESTATQLPHLERMEAMFGTDLSDVSAYTGLGDALDGLGARAVALGPDAVAFAESAPTPEIVAHETAHLVQAQQSSGGEGVSAPGDRAEREAVAAERAVGAGEAMEISAAPTGELSGGWFSGVVDTVKKAAGWVLDKLGFGSDEHAETSEDSQGATEGTAAEEKAPEPVLDLTPYTWLLDLYTGTGGISRGEAEALLRTASVAQLNGAGTPAATAAAGGAPTVAPASIGDRTNNPAYGLDWNQAAQPGHMAPQRPEGIEADQMANTDLAAVFAQHRDNNIVATFGAGSTHARISGGAKLAEALGRADVAGRLRAGLFHAAQQAVVATLDVESSGRYAARNGNTYCNIYAHDVTAAFGAYLPRVWWYDTVLARIQAGEEAITLSEYRRRVEAGEPTQGLIYPVYGETVREMNANSLQAWLLQWGGTYGWEQAADVNAAQEAANAGSLAILSAANVNAGSPGHISIILSEGTDGGADRTAEGEVNVPLQSQAGGTNFREGTGSRWWDNANHTRGAAWIFRGSANGGVVTPESLVVGRRDSY